jgi:hypothetical protein
MKPNGAFEWENIINMDAKEWCKFVVGSSEHCNKPERSTKGGKFLDQLSD